MLCVMSGEQCVDARMRGCVGTMDSMGFTESMESMGTHGTHGIHGIPWMPMESRSVQIATLVEQDPRSSVSESIRTNLSLFK